MSETNWDDLSKVPDAGAAPEAGQGAAPVLASGRLSSASGPVVLDSLVRRAGTWAGVAIVLFPLLAIWALPAALLTGQRAQRGDLVGAEASAKTCKTLGLVAIGLLVLLVLVWVIMVASLASGLENVDSVST